MHTTSDASGILRSTACSETCPSAVGVALPHAGHESVATLVTRRRRATVAHSGHPERALPFLPLRLACGHLELRMTVEESPKHTLEHLLVGHGFDGQRVFAGEARVAIAASAANGAHHPLDAEKRE